MHLMLKVDDTDPNQEQQPTPMGNKLVTGGAKKKKVLFRGVPNEGKEDRESSPIKENTTFMKTRLQKRK